LRELRSSCEQFSKNTVDCFSSNYYLSVSASDYRIGFIQSDKSFNITSVCSQNEELFQVIRTQGRLMPYWIFHISDSSSS